MKLLLIFIYLITSNISYALEKPNIKNLVLSKNPKTYEEVVFKDSKNYDVNLDDFKGKLLILNFWATWCPPCIAEMPDINKLYQSVNKEVHFAIISVDEDREKAKAFAKRKDFDFPIYFPKSRLPKVYESTTIPTTYVIDTKGHIVISQRGMAKYSSDAFITYLREL